jgi:hypothetical protein
MSRLHPQGRELTSPHRLTRADTSRWLPAFALLLCLAPAAQPGWAASSLPAVKLTYRGGMLIPKVKVASLFWGSSWQSAPLTGYFNSFFKALFADGRYMANLAQYSAGGYTIGNGSFVVADNDTQNPPAKVTDAQIQAEIAARIAAGHLPQPDDNTAYFVFTPSGTIVYDSTGASSVTDFASYHDYDFNDRFPYGVIPYDDTLQDPRLMTVYASHELAEVVTDPQPYDGLLGWYDDYYGEVGDIPATLWDNYQISDSQYVDELDAADGTPYLVQTVWSNKDAAPVAFAGG